MKDHFDELRQQLPSLISSGALAGSVADCRHAPSGTVDELAMRFFDWQDNRRQSLTWPYANVLKQGVGPHLTVATDAGETSQGLNFASQDYLGLASDSRLREAACEAIESHGLHSAGSPALQGNTPLTAVLESALADALQMEHVLLFPTGWAAGFGVIAALVRKKDHIVINQLAHNCLSRGAAYATPNVYSMRHLHLHDLQARLRRIRATDTENTILVVTEGLFSMDADVPDLEQYQEICHEYRATLLVDVAHDFGSMGPNGTGSLGAQGMLGQVDLVMGSFSKTFASNGGFVATHSRALQQYIKYFGDPHIFSNSLSPVQCRVVTEALRIVRSPEGEERRRRLFDVVRTLRTAIQQRQGRCLGEPSPIVPVLLGSDPVARLTSRLCFRSGLFANLVEYPAVAVGSARFRMQAMALHSPRQAEEAARMICEAWEMAQSLMAEAGGATPAQKDDDLLGVHAEP